MIGMLALVSATTFEDLTALDRDVAVAAAAMGVVTTPIDRRLRLARCPEGVAITEGTDGALTVRCPSLGWRLRLPTVRAARSQPVVRRGDPLTVSSGGPGFVVEATGIATEDGTQGSTIRAKLDGGRQISGTVTGAGEISIGRP